MSYPVKTLNGLASANTNDAIDYILSTSPEYGTKETLPDGREFTYCYTALTTLLKGGQVCIDYTGGAAAGQNPRATIPATSAIAHKFGRAAETITAAGGIWVQTYGRCNYARVDGATDVAIGAFLKPANAVQYAVIDHPSVATASATEIAEEVVTAAIAAQTDTTNGDANVTVFITGKLATVA